MPTQKKDTRTRILETTWKLLEIHPGHSPSMSDIAKSCGISRQALYLHFPSRTELLIATTRYVDDIKGLEQRLQELYAAGSGSEMLRLCIQVWANYIPEVYAVAKALMMSKDTDEAAAAAWTEIMNCLYEVCRAIVKKLSKENKLSPGWSKRHAADFIWAMISIHQWEHLTMDRGWNRQQYISHITRAITRALIPDS